MFYACQGYQQCHVRQLSTTSDSLCVKDFIRTCPSVKARLQSLLMHFAALILASQWAGVAQTAFVESAPPLLSSRAFLMAAVLLKVSLVVWSRKTSSPSSPTSPPWTSATFCVGTLQTAPLQLTLAPRAFHSRAPVFSSLLATSYTSVLAAPP